MAKQNRFGRYLRAPAIAATGFLAAACAGDSGTATPEQSISHDIAVVHGRSPGQVAPGEAFATPRPPRAPEPPAAVRAGPAGTAAGVSPPLSGKARAGHNFAIASCTPCHVVSPAQRTPVRFANAPSFRAIANEPGTTALGLNIWLTNPHPTMPQLVLAPQEAADVIAYVMSLRGKH